MQTRASGSSGGHNGLKDIEACLKSKEYPRLRSVNMCLNTCMYVDIHACVITYMYV